MGGKLNRRKVGKKQGKERERERGERKREEREREENYKKLRNQMYCKGGRGL